MDHSLLNESDCEHVVATTGYDPMTPFLDRHLPCLDTELDDVDWSEEQLAELVTRDSMIGTGFPKTPGAPS